MALFNGKLAYRQQTIKPVSVKDDKSKIGYVYDVILDDDGISGNIVEIDDTEFKNVSLVGAIRFRFGNDTISSPSELSFAFPFGKPKICSRL
jgi:hypothetical protein